MEVAARAGGTVLGVEGCDAVVATIPGVNRLRWLERYSGREVANVGEE
jgi:hypothetical protein